MGTTVGMTVGTVGASVGDRTGADEEESGSEGITVGAEVGNTQMHSISAPQERAEPYSLR